MNGGALEGHVKIYLLDGCGTNVRVGLRRIDHMLNEPARCGSFDFFLVIGVAWTAMPGAFFFASPGTFPIRRMLAWTLVCR